MMSYKKIKKVQKQKVTHLISPDLIKNKRFDDVIKQLNDKTELTNQDRYLYGYSLLQTQQHLNALIALWPLASSKKQAILLNDCATIAHHVVNDEDLLSSESLSEDALHTLFLAVRTLDPQNPVCNTLKQRLCTSLWHNSNHEKLECILKSAKGKKSVFLVENLGKLAFFQAGSKLTGGIPAFIGLVLTGGACLIAQHSIYNADIEEEIRALGNEIKLLLSQLKTKGSQKLAWDTALIDNFIDYEADIIVEILQQRVRQDELNLEITPTPSYFITYGATDDRLSQTFLPWLSKQSQMVELYQANTQQIVLWVLGGKELPVIKGILKSVQLHQLHPYLRLAIMLRAEYIKTSSLLPLVQIGDFKNRDETTNIFKNIAVQTVKSILNSTSSIIENPIFWKILIDFYPVLNDQKLKQAILSRSLKIFYQQYRPGDTLNLSTMKTIAHQMEHFNLEQQLNVFSERQDTCSQFLLNIEDTKKSKKSITAIKNELGLRMHLALIADSSRFIYEKESFTALFQHLKLLVQNKAINKFILLKELFECDFSYACPPCFQVLFETDISFIIEKLNLPVVQLPNVPDTENQLSSPNTSQSSVLSRSDPFTILGIAFNDSKPVIMQKMMKLIQQSPDKMAIFRQAQSELFHPARRFLHHYLQFINHENEPIELDGSAPSYHVTASLNEIPLRHELFNAN